LFKDYTQLKPPFAKINREAMTISLPLSDYLSLVWHKQMVGISINIMNPNLIIGRERDIGIAWDVRGNIITTINVYVKRPIGRNTFHLTQVPFINQ
jgi:hypothetical protein